MPIWFWKYPLWVRWGLYAVGMQLFIALSWMVSVQVFIACEDTGPCLTGSFLDTALSLPVLILQPFISPIFFLADIFGDSTPIFILVGADLVIVFVIGGCIARVWSRLKKTMRPMP